MLKNAWERIANLPGLRALTDRDVRYMTLYGYPIDRPLYKSFWRPAHFKMMAALTALPVAFAIAEKNYARAATYILGGALSYAFTEAGARAVIKVKVKNWGCDMDQICIDKNGRQARLSSYNPRNDFLAEDIKDLSLQWTGLFVLSATPTCFNTLTEYISTIMNQSSMSFPGLPFTAGLVFSDAFVAKRFDNVVKHRWAIVDRPALRQEQEKQVPDALPQTL